VTAELASFSTELVAGGVRRGSDIRARYPQLANLAQVLEFPNLFARWRRLMVEQSGMKSASWDGNRFASLHQRLLIQYSTFTMEAVFLILGIAVCCAAMWRSLRTREPTALAVPLIYFAINYLLIASVLPLNWDRYYVPTVVAGRILIAVAIYEVITMASRAAPVRGASPP
jgi:hypothetical protein